MNNPNTNPNPNQDHDNQKGNDQRQGQQDQGKPTVVHPDDRQGTEKQQPDKR